MNSSSSVVDHLSAPHGLHSFNNRLLSFPKGHRAVTPQQASIVLEQVNEARKVLTKDSFDFYYNHPQGLSIYETTEVLCDCFYVAYSVTQNILLKNVSNHLLTIFKGQLSKLIVVSKLPRFLCFIQLNKPILLDRSFVSMDGAQSDLRIVWNVERLLNYLTQYPIKQMFNLSANQDYDQQEIKNDLFILLQKSFTQPTHILMSSLATLRQKYGFVHPNKSNPPINSLLQLQGQDEQSQGDDAMDQQESVDESVNGIKKLNI